MVLGDNGGGLAKAHGEWRCGEIDEVGKLWEIEGEMAGRWRQGVAVNMSSVRRTSLR
jgi:hypothetical protein